MYFYYKKFYFKQILAKALLKKCHLKKVFHHNIPKRKIEIFRRTCRCRLEAASSMDILTFSHLFGRESHF